MKEIEKTIQVAQPVDTAFEKFVHDLNEWWPKEYTWSGNKLVKIKIDPMLNGLCTETGPFDFRCDWGRVTEFTDNKKVSFKWQISPARIPVPDPDLASDVSISFLEVDDSVTRIDLRHTNFEKHGDGSEEYYKAMNSREGWEYILQRYQEFVKDK